MNIPEVKISDGNNVREQIYSKINAVTDWTFNSNSGYIIRIEKLGEGGERVDCFINL